MKKLKPNKNLVILVIGNPRGWVVALFGNKSILGIDQGNHDLYLDYRERVQLRDIPI